jgi:hypothetical protein
MFPQRGFLCFPKEGFKLLVCVVFFPQGGLTMAALFFCFCVEATELTSQFRDRLEGTKLILQSLSSSGSRGPTG